MFGSCGMYLGSIVQEIRTQNNINIKPQAGKVHFVAVSALVDSLSLPRSQRAGQTRTVQAMMWLVSPAALPVVRLLNMYPHPSILYHSPLWSKVPTFFT